MARRKKRNLEEDADAAAQIKKLHQSTYITVKTVTRQSLFAKASPIVLRVKTMPVKQSANERKSKQWRKKSAQT